MKFICKEFWEEVFKKKVSLASFDASYKHYNTSPPFFNVIALSKINDQKLIYLNDLITAECDN